MDKKQFIANEIVRFFRVFKILIPVSLVLTLVLLFTYYKIYKTFNSNVTEAIFEFKLEREYESYSNPEKPFKTYIIDTISYGSESNKDLMFMSGYVVYETGDTTLMAYNPPWDDTEDFQESILFNLKHFRRAAIKASLKIPAVVLMVLLLLWTILRYIWIMVVKGYKWVKKHKSI